MNATDYFPYSAPRDGQLEAITDIKEALIDNGYEYAVLDAGTGFGKSGIAFSLANYSSDVHHARTFLLTATKNLQSQYYREAMKLDFDADYEVAKGRSNYTCKVNGKSCNQGECKVKEVLEKERCPYGLYDFESLSNGGCNYWVAKSLCASSDVAIMNYDVLMVDRMYVNHYLERDLMICDEAHNIESKVMSQVCISISERQLNKIGTRFTDDDLKQYDVEYWIRFVEALINLCKEKERNAEYIGLKQHELDDLVSLGRSLSWKLAEMTRFQDYWVVNIDAIFRKVELKPIKVSKYAKDMLLSCADKKLFMSGSFIDYRQFCNDLGIDPDDVHYHHASSGFDMKRNNPIIRRLAGSMGYRHKSQTLPKTIPILYSIFNENEGRKGLVHCNSREFANFIMTNVASDRLITYDSSEDKDHKINEFRESDDLIMVSYSMTEGVDLPYDGIRFQVFYKIPYLSLADNQVKARLNVDPNWYNVKTMQTLLQAWGRGMRAEDDQCTNYVIDNGINRILHDKAFRNLVPDEFREAII